MIPWSILVRHAPLIIERLWAATQRARTRNGPTFSATVAEQLRERFRRPSDHVEPLREMQQWSAVRRGESVAFKHRIDRHPRVGSLQWPRRVMDVEPVGRPGMVVVIQAIAFRQEVSSVPANGCQTLPSDSYVASKRTPGWHDGKRGMTLH